MVNQKFLKASDTIYGNDKRLQITFEFFSKPILWDFLPQKTVKDPIKIPVLQDYLFRKVFFYEILKRNEKKKRINYANFDILKEVNWISFQASTDTFCYVPTILLHTLWKYKYLCIQKGLCYVVQFRYVVKI